MSESILDVDRLEFTKSTHIANTGISLGNSPMKAFGGSILEISIVVDKWDQFSL